MASLPLTGLPGRELLSAALESALAEARRDGSGLALVCAGLDGLRLVAEGLGQEAADRLLRDVSARLEETVRPGDVVVRTGAGEFLVLVRDLPAGGREHAEALGERICDALQGPFAVGAAELLVDVSLGVSLFPRDASEPDALVRHADAALAEAKAAGGGVAVYGAGTADPLERLELAARLRRAIDADELELHYQPIFRLPDVSMMGVEALVRWRDGERGLVPPADFVPVAERTGVIDALGDWVLETLCRQASEWLDRGLVPGLGINISPRQLRRRGFARGFAERVAAHGLDPSRFVLELTETAWTLEASRLLPVLGELRAEGLALAIDDFGAGYSSLWRLRELPVQVIKVDRSFLHGVPHDTQAAGVFSAILHLADAVGCDVVAEGVEEPAQLEFLRSEGCRLLQGFHLGRPVPAWELEAQLAEAIVPERRRAGRPLPF